MSSTEGATAEPDASDCGRCGARLHGRWCHDCGYDSRPPARSARDLLDDVLDNVFSFTAAAPSTAHALVMRPSLVPRAQLAGDGRILSPMKLYLTASLVFFLFLALSGVTIFQLRVERTGEPHAAFVGDSYEASGFRIVDQWLRPRSGAEPDPAVIGAIDRALDSPEAEADPVGSALFRWVRAAALDPGAVNERIATWAPRVLWLLMPVHALLLWGPYARGHLLVEHVIVALWAHAVLFLALVAGALWNLIGLERGLGIALLAYQAYLTAGLKGFYGSSWPWATAKALAHTLAYLGLIWLPLTAGFFLWQGLEMLPAGYWQEE